MRRTKKTGKKRKKGVEMSLAVVVKATIILLIAVILIYLLKKGLEPMPPFTKSCEDKGGYCTTNPCSMEGAQEMPFKGCEKTYGPGAHCCYKDREEP